mmetsp:Transcript_15504/g.42019  ORF Transcript_15504/g.42019 Transcript_15504/m.42019 type:complete len:220 (+) Transcript_15504:866-1525(+)
MWGVLLVWAGPLAWRRGVLLVQGVSFGWAFEGGGLSALDQASDCCKGVGAEGWEKEGQGQVCAEESAEEVLGQGLVCAEGTDGAAWLRPQETSAPQEARRLVRQGGWVEQGKLSAVLFLAAFLAGVAHRAPESGGGGAGMETWGSGFSGQQAAHPIPWRIGQGGQEQQAGWRLEAQAAARGWVWRLSETGGWRGLLGRRHVRRWSPRSPAGVAVAPWPS